MHGSSANGTRFNCPLSLIRVKFKSSLIKSPSWAARLLDLVKKSFCFAVNDPDDLSETIWEGAITQVTIKRDTVHFTGYDYKFILNYVMCEYNSIFAAGEITAISDPTITDSEAAFSDLLNKLVSFTDAEGPDQEEATGARRE